MEASRLVTGGVLDDLREVLLSVGFTVARRPPQESTLRVYPNGFRSYPLLNPRFEESGSGGLRLEVSVFSRRGDEAPESWLGNTPQEAGWTYEPTGEDLRGYRHHGYFVFHVPISPERQPDLAALRSDFLRLREFIQRQGA